MTTPRLLRPERSTLERYRGLREGMCWLVVASLVGGSVLLSCGGRSSEHRAPSGTAGSEVTGAGAMAGQAVGSEAGGGATAGGGASTPCSEDASDGGCPEGCDSSSDVDCGLQPGLSCTRDQECQSQSCVGGVCCQEACGACQVCSDDGLSCSPVPYRQTWESEGESCSGDRWCDGLGACRPKVQVSGNDSNTCVLLETGDVRCWGDAQWGQLGYGSVETVGDDEVPAAVAPIQLGALALEVAVGGAHACALLLDGNVRCWGRNFEGRLGSGPPKVLSGENIGDDEHPDSFGPVSLGARAKQVVAGDQHTCALLLDGNVRCWGYDASGQAGYVRNGGLSSFPEPPSVAGTSMWGGA